MCIRDSYIPLIPVQILWMNLITDGFPALALGIDIPERNIMARKATKQKEQILSKGNLGMVFWQGLILTLGSLTIYFLEPLLFHDVAIFNETEIFQTSVFTTLVLAQLMHAYNYRVNNKGIFRKGLFANKFLNLSFLVSMLLQIGIIYIPVLQNVFKTRSLNLYQWLLIISCSLGSVLLINLIDVIINFKKNRSNRLAGS